MIYVYIIDYSSYAGSVVTPLALRPVDSAQIDSLLHHLPQRGHLAQPGHVLYTELHSQIHLFLRGEAAWKSSTIFTYRSIKITYASTTASRRGELKARVAPIPNRIEECADTSSAPIDLST